MTEPFYMTETGNSTRLERSKKQLDHFAWLLDDCFRIPGLNWRFGLDALIGLIPGAGDVVGGALGLLLLFRAIQFRLPGIVIVRMIVNHLLDFTIGAVPLLGDAFDFFFKSNALNMRLFQEYATDPGKGTRKQWIFVASIITGTGALMLLLILAAGYLAFRMTQVFLSLFNIG